MIKRNLTRENTKRRKGKKNKGKIIDRVVPQVEGTLKN